MDNLKMTKELSPSPSTSKLSLPEATTTSHSFCTISDILKAEVRLAAKEVTFYYKKTWMTLKLQET